MKKIRTYVNNKIKLFLFSIKLVFYSPGICVPEWTSCRRETSCEDGVFFEI